MKLLLDENISYRIKNLIDNYFDDVLHINEILPTQAKDIEIWELAKVNNYTILTLDSDFRELLVMRGFPPKLIWIRTGNISKAHLAEKLIHNIDNIQKFEKDEFIGIIEIY